MYACKFSSPHIKSTKVTLQPTSSWNPSLYTLSPSAQLPYPWQPGRDPHDHDSDVTSKAVPLAVERISPHWSYPSLTSFQKTWPHSLHFIIALIVIAQLAMTRMHHDSISWHSPGRCLEDATAYCTHPSHHSEENPGSSALTFMMGEEVVYAFRQDCCLFQGFFSPVSCVQKISHSSQSLPVSLPTWNSGWPVPLGYAILNESVKLSILPHAFVQQPITEAQF